jgi:ABC-type multidrug transport system fused ATPase/permease subunit
LTAI